MFGQSRLAVPVLGVMLTAACALAACSGERELICNPDSDYQEADSVGQLRIPDDLSVPDETDSLRIPDTLPAAETASQPPGGCLEASPAFVQGE